MKHLLLNSISANSHGKVVTYITNTDNNNKNDNDYNNDKNIDNENDDDNDDEYILIHLSFLSLLSLALFSLSTLKLGIYSNIFYISDNNRDTDKKLSAYDPWGPPTTSRMSWMTQQIIEILSQKFQHMLLGVYPLHQEHCG